jgi:gluconate/galactonate dehydratase
MKCISGERTPEERIRYVVDRVEAIHRVVPDMAVRPDLRWRLEEVWVAQELARRLQGHRVESLESPIAKGAAAGTFSEWRRLRQTIGLPVADHVAGADDLIRRFQAEALDNAIVGAESHLETLALSRLAHQLGMDGWSQTVAYGPGAAMGLHVAACMPHLTRPYDMVGPMAWEHDLTREPFLFAEGSLLVPERPGLGFTLDPQAVAQYLVRRQTIE